MVELATDNLAALPADWVYENFGRPAPPSVFDRFWLVMSLAELGRFAEAAEHEAEAIRLAEPTQHALHRRFGLLRRGHAPSPQGRLGEGALTDRTRGSRCSGRGNIVIMLPYAVAASAWVLAQARRGGRGAEPAAGGRADFSSVTRRGESSASRGWAYHALGRACLLLGRLDEAQRLADRAIESSPRSPRVRGPRPAPARRHRDPSRSARCRERRGPLPPGAGARRAARHAPPRRPLPPRPRQALPAHRQAASRRRSTSPPRRRCTARWTCASGWSRCRPRRVARDRRGARSVRHHIRFRVLKNALRTSPPGLEPLL